MMNMAESLMLKKGRRCGHSMAKLGNDTEFRRLEYDGKLITIRDVLQLPFSHAFMDSVKLQLLEISHRRMKSRTKKHRKAGA